MLLEASGSAASVNPSALTPPHKKTRVTESQHAKKRMRTLAHSRAPHSATASAHSAAAHYSSRSRHHYYERFHTSSFASDITEGDVTAGEDPVVRQAAIDALGNMNGTVVAIEPTDAGGSLLFDIRHGVASADIMDAVGHRRANAGFAGWPQPHESHRSAGALE